MSFFVNSSKLFSFIRNNIFGLTVCIVYSIVLAIGLHQHEMWRDELEWYLRRLYQPFLSEGDPCYLLYNAIISIFISIKKSESMFQAAHFVIILAAVVLINLSSPFNKYEKTLLSFGYYFLYEYGVIARYYGLLVLLVLMICWLLGKKNINYTLTSILIIVLADHNPSATVFAACLSLYLVTRTFNDLKTNKIQIKSNYNLIIGAATLLLGWIAFTLVFCVSLLKFYTKIIYKGGTPPLFTIVNSIWNSYIPIPDLTQKVRFWWTNIIPFPVAYPPNYHFELSDMTWEYGVAFILSLIILLAIISKFRNKPIILIIFALNTLLYGIFLQSSLKVYTSRYLGLLFLIFVYCYWLFLNEKMVLSLSFIERGISLMKLRSMEKIFSFAEKYFQLVVYIILGSSVLASIVAYTKENQYKFSLSRDAANYIKFNNLQNTHILIGYPDYAAQCISAHLDIPIYYPQIGKENYYSGCFMKEFKQNLDFSDLVDACTKFTEGENKKALLILNFPIMLDSSHPLVAPIMLTPKTSISLLQAISTEVINPDEQFWLYEVCKIP